MDLGVAGKTYVLVGGSRGMGWETARCLAADGGRVAIVSRNEAGAQAAAAALAAEYGVAAIGLAADATHGDAIDAALSTAVDRLGPLKGLLITTGMTARGDYLHEATDDDWAARFEDVLMGTVRATRAAVRHMRMTGGGAIVTSAAYTAHEPQPERCAYAALKAAIINLTKNIALSYGGEGIRANCVCPGAFETERSSARIDVLCKEHGWDRATAGRHLMEEVFHMPVALRRIGSPAEAGDLMAFLLSSRAAYLTGATINIDGGTTF
jgi:NAD(P)-dependent dehydrogenase (short-subunit alcohol dehydrogenase family)